MVSVEAASKGNSWGTSIQINIVADRLVLQEHVWPVATTTELQKCYSYQLPDILILPLLISLHTFGCASPVPSDNHTVWLCSPQYEWVSTPHMYLEPLSFNIVCVQVLGCRLWLLRKEVRKWCREEILLWLLYFCCILSFCLPFQLKGHLIPAKLFTVCCVCVCVWETHKQKRDKSDTERHCTAGFCLKSISLP